MNTIESADNPGPLCDKKSEMQRIIVETKERIARMLLEHYDAVLTQEQLAIQLLTLTDLGQELYDAVHPDSAMEATHGQ